MPQAAEPKPAPITSSVMLWTLKGTFEERLETAARAGIQSVELVREHVNWADGDIARIRKLLRSMRLGIDVISATPNWKEMPVSMVDPAQRAGFLAEVTKNIDAARKLEAPMLLLMTGDAIPGKSRREQWASVVEGCKRVGDLAEKAGVTLIVEPLNTRANHQGYFLDNCVDGLRLIKEADHPRVRLLFDLYHEQVQSGNVAASVEAAAPYVRVFHVADNPGRNDPGTGEMNFDFLYKTIKKAGYKGYVAMEYLPVGDPVASLIRSVDAMRKSLSD